MPAGMHAYGSPSSAARAATIACDPSPPAIASASAPRSTAALTSSFRSSSRFSTTASIPRARASSSSEKRSALPPPDFGFISSTARVGASAAGRSPRFANARREAATPSTIAASPTRAAARRSSTTATTSTAAKARPPSPRPSARRAPRRSSPHHAAAAARDEQQRLHQPVGEVAERQVDADEEGDQAAHQRGHGREPAAGHTISMP